LYFILIHFSFNLKRTKTIKILMCGKEQKPELEPWKKRALEPKPHSWNPRALKQEPELCSCDISHKKIKFYIFFYSELEDFLYL